MILCIAARMLEYVVWGKICSLKIVRDKVVRFGVYFDQTFVLNISKKYYFFI